MTNGLKVYYAPWVPLFQNCTLPTFFPLLPLLREVVLRERIEIVHGHQDSSSMMHEALFHAQTLGLRTCFTSHSLFNLYDNGSVHLNKVLRLTLCSVDHCVAVSFTCKENICVRCDLDPDSVSVIPNAVDASYFTPEPSLRAEAPRINIVSISRLAYRKGTDLVAQVIPIVCAKFPHVNFIIGGDGDKRLMLDEMRERHQLHDRVELLGSVPHTEVRSVLCRGSIFLNCSLTEAFCISILEAACCGLYVVSTRVGGIPEVLPPDMIGFAEEVSAGAVAAALERAIVAGKGQHEDPFDLHERVRDMYSWQQVAEEVTSVYDQVVARPRQTFTARLDKCWAVGPIAGIMGMFLVTVDLMVLWLLRLIRPDEEVDRAPEIALPLSKRSGGVGYSKQGTS